MYTFAEIARVVFGYLWLPIFAIAIGTVYGIARLGLHIVHKIASKIKQMKGVCNYEN